MTGAIARPILSYVQNPHIWETNMVVKLEVRLDDERGRRLDELVSERGEPISSVIRSLIDDAYEDAARERRRRALARLSRLEVEDPPDAATISRQLEAAHASRSVC